jgi:succinyl-CoA synthetase beta subunit
MRLCEAEAKVLLSNAGIALPKSRLIEAGATIDVRGFNGGVAKAQLLSGGRGKAGLVRFAVDQQSLHAEVEHLRARIAAAGKPGAVLIEERLELAAEYYLSFVIDDVLQRAVLLFSMQGGIDIEDAGDALHRLPIDPLMTLRPHHLLAFFTAAGITGKQLGALARLACSLHRVFVDEDADMLEINPLALTKAGKLLPLDAKMVLDDSATGRHRGRCTPLSDRLEDAELTPRERDAAALGFTFVEMPGDVAIMSAGAGMGMMLVDLVGQAGLKPACFVDGAVGSNSDQTDERLRLVFKRAESDDVKAIMFYQTLSTRDLKPRVESLLRLLKETPPSKPFYFGLSATYLAERNMTAKQACALMKEHGYFATSEADELVARIKSDLSKNEQDHANAD